MGDVGISALKPQYEKALLVPEDLSYWEAAYTDGTVLSEASGGTYPQIDRTHLQSFRIVHAGEIVFEMFVPSGLTGHNLVYRRRTSIVAESGARDVVFLVGFLTRGNGPLIEVDIARNSYREAPELVSTLVPMPGEPDDLLLTQ